MTKSVKNELVKNNVLLQKKTTELLTAVNKLAKKIDKMVDIFEKAAEYVEKEAMKEPSSVRMGELLEQNKKIARGLLTLEKYVREKSALNPPNLRKEKEY